MATRQYIGARYVTKIYENSLDPSSAEWEAGVTYEPLTMVTYNNSSYLSKKEVPGSIGDPAANPSYWVVTGAYNGQIASLQAQIDNINNVIIPSITNTLDDVDIRTSSDLPKPASKVVFFGDSWTDPNVYTWVTDYFEPFTGMTTYNYALNGARINPNASVNFSQEVDTFEADTSIDKDEVSLIIIIGGLNDIRDGRTSSQIKNDTNDLGDRLSLLCKNAKIYTFFNEGLPLKNYNSTIYDLVGNVNGKYHPIHMLGWFAGEHFDNTHFHLTPVGNARLGRNIANKVLNIPALLPSTSATTRTYTDSGTGVKFFGWFISNENGCLTNSYLLVFPSGTTTTANISIPIVDTNLLTWTVAAETHPIINSDGTYGYYTTKYTTGTETIDIEISNCKGLQVVAGTSPVFLV